MIVRQESLTVKMSLKDLSSTSPLPTASLVLVFGSVKRFGKPKLQATLVEGAGDAAHLVADQTCTGQAGLAVCLSCVGRKGVMATQVADEVKLIQKILGPQTMLTGFYSYGELAPRPDTNDNVLHNQTMTIGYLSENLLA